MLDADAVINNSSQKVGGSGPRKTHRIYTPVSSALGVLNDYALYARTHSLTHSRIFPPTVFSSTAIPTSRSSLSQMDPRDASRHAHRIAYYFASAAVAVDSSYMTAPSSASCIDSVHLQTVLIDTCRQYDSVVGRAQYGQT